MEKKMLSREKAKKTTCPYKRLEAAILLNGGEVLQPNQILCNAEGCPKWKDSKDISFWCEQTYSSEFDTIHLQNCIYPKLRTMSCKNNFMLDRKDLLRLSSHCEKCESRYGRCAG